MRAVDRSYNLTPKRLDRYDFKQLQNLAAIFWHLATDSATHAKSRQVAGRRST